jgi:uncharacterized Zn-binding protein involved in type VI secretion
MKPAARITDLHAGCLADGGGAIIAGSPNVVIGFMAAARVGDKVLCLATQDTIVSGAASVVINFQPAARVGEATTHGSVIQAGCPTVLIGDMPGFCSPSQGMASVQLRDAALNLQPPEFQTSHPETHNEQSGSTAGGAPSVSPLAPIHASLNQAAEQGTALIECAQCQALAQAAQQPDLPEPEPPGPNPQLAPPPPPPPGTSVCQRCLELAAESGEALVDVTEQKDAMTQAVTSHEFPGHGGLSPVPYEEISTRQKLTS